MDYTLLNSNENTANIKLFWNDYFLLCPSNEQGKLFSMLLDNYIFKFSKNINHSCIKIIT